MAKRPRPRSISSRKAPAPGSFAFFETIFGTCAIAWTERGITCVQWTEGDLDATATRVRVQAGEVTLAAPPAWVEGVTIAVARHLAGEAQDFAGVPLDYDRVPPFHRRVYEDARRVGSGKTTSYGEIARRLGSPMASRAVGQAMAKNPFIIVVPCHRVLSAGGKPGGFSARGGLDTKAKLLALEGCTRLFDR